MAGEAERIAGVAGHPGLLLRSGFTERITARVAPLVSLLLYLCSEGADYPRPAAPRPTPTKRGMRFFAPDQPTTWEVGTRIGAALRAHRDPPSTAQGETAIGRAPPRGHMRAAHWSLYWTGPRDGERIPVLRWLAPIPVNMDLGDDLPAVIRSVG